MICMTLIYTYTCSLSTKVELVRKFTSYILDFTEGRPASGVTRGLTAEMTLLFSIGAWLAILAIGGN